MWFQIVSSENKMMANHFLELFKDRLTNFVFEV